MYFHQHFLNKAKFMICYINERPKISSVYKYSFSYLRYIERFIWSRIIILDKGKHFKKRKRSNKINEFMEKIKPLEWKIKVKDLLFDKYLSMRGNFNFKSIKLLLNNFTGIEKWIQKLHNKNILVYMWKFYSTQPPPPHP